MAGLLEINQVGGREDLADVIANVDAKSCPVMQSIKKGSTPGNTQMGWLMDSYEAASADNAVIDGVDVSSYENAAQNRFRQEIYLQKAWKTPKVSDMAQNVTVVAKLGRKGEMAEAIVKKTVELKRDIEATICSDNDTQADTGSVPYKTRGLGSWISNSAQGVFPVDAAYRTPAASINGDTMATLLESEVQGILSSVYNQTGTIQKYYLPCGRQLKTRFTDFAMYQTGVSSSIAGSRQMNQTGRDGRLVATIDFFAGDFGEVELHPSTFLGVGTANASDFRGYVLDLSMLELRYNRTPGFEELPNLGGGPRGVIDAIFGLCYKNPLGGAKFNGTAAS